MVLIVIGGSIVIGHFDEVEGGNQRCVRDKEVMARRRKFSFIG
jgi:hypothetical protein